MSAVITVFLHQNEPHKMTEPIRRLQKYFNLYVDSSNTSPIVIKARYYSTNHRFFKIEDELMMYEAEIVDMVQPDFALMYGPQETLTKPQWKLMFNFLKSLILDPILDIDTFKAIESFYEPIRIQVAKKEEIQASKLCADGYSFRYHHLPDTMKVICEIVRNNTDRPYVVVLGDYHTNKFENMFGKFYFDDSWGYGYDNNFMLTLAKELGYTIDIDQEFIKMKKKCISDGSQVPEATPEVHRMTIEQYISHLNSERDSFNRIQKLIE